MYYKRSLKKAAGKRKKDAQDVGSTGSEMERLKQLEEYLEGLGKPLCTRRERPLFLILRDMGS